MRLDHQVRMPGAARVFLFVSVNSTCLPPHPHPFATTPHRDNATASARGAGDSRSTPSRD